MDVDMLQYMFACPNARCMEEGLWEEAVNLDDIYYLSENYLCIIINWVSIVSIDEAFRVAMEELSSNPTCISISPHPPPGKYIVTSHYSRLKFSYNQMALWHIYF